MDSNDQRRCVIKALALEVEGRSDITIDLTSPGSLESLKTKPFTIKEGAKFRMYDSTTMPVAHSRSFNRGPITVAIHTLRWTACHESQLMRWDFRKANFVVQHDVLSGLRYIQAVKRKGIRVAKNEEMIVWNTMSFFKSAC